MLKDCYANFSDLPKHEQIKLFNLLKEDFIDTADEEIMVRFPAPAYVVVFIKKVYNKKSPMYFIHRGFFILHRKYFVYFHTNKNSNHMRFLVNGYFRSNKTISLPEYFPLRIRISPVPSCPLNILMELKA
jgi:hypothetical protein